MGKQISLKTDDLCLLTKEQMLDVQGGNPTSITASSEICVTVVIDIAWHVIDYFLGRQGQEQEQEVEDTTSQIIVDGNCELEPAYCYSYA